MHSHAHARAYNHLPPCVVHVMHACLLASMWCVHVTTISLTYISMECPLVMRPNSIHNIVVYLFLLRHVIIMTENLLASLAQQAL